MRATKVTLLGVGLVLTAGCYAFVPIQSAAVTPGTRVRITMDREETLRQADALGQLQSVVTGVTTDGTNATSVSFIYRLPSPTPAQPNRFNGLMSVPWSSVVQIEEQRFSAGRTLGLAALGAVVTVAVLAATEGGTSQECDTPGPDVDAALIPIFRFVWQE